MNACGSECISWQKSNKLPTLGMMYDDADSWPTTAPVGSFPKGASPFGLQDMVGNVWEWVGDYWGPYDKAEQRDPHGPPTGAARVIRGGAWNGADPSWVRPTYRYMTPQDNRSYGVGFRCAADPR